MADQLEVSVLRRLRTLGRAGAMGVILGACVAVTPAQAEPQATPYDCFTQFESDWTGAYSYCASGPGSHRVKITCRRASNPNVVDIIYGYWRPAGYYSDAHCNNYWDSLLSGTYQVKAS
jgi:hypothetical protein